MKKKIFPVTLLVASGVLPIVLASTTAHAHSQSVPHIHFDSAAVVVVALAAVLCAALAVKICWRGARVMTQGH